MNAQTGGGAISVVQAGLGVRPPLSPPPLAGVQKGGGAPLGGVPLQKGHVFKVAFSNHSLKQL